VHTAYRREIDKSRAPAYIAIPHPRNKGAEVQKGKNVTTLQTIPSGGALAPVSATIGNILHLAVEKGMDPAGLEKLFALYERDADRKAAQEFAEAKAAFQSEVPPIRKTSEATVMSNRTGSTHKYKYAELDEIARTVRDPLTKNGLSYSWDSHLSDKGNMVCTCIIRHVNGHKESASFECSTDTPASMTAQQKNAAALTYARRQSLIQALGLTTCDPDNDGADLESGEPVSAEQAANLETAVDGVGGNRAAFLRYFKVERFSDIPLSRYGEALKMIEDKRKAAK
jgi:hypothetical protein